MADKDLEQIEKVNSDNKIEVIKINERLSNHKKEKDEVIAKLKELKVDIDQAEMVLEESEEELAKLITDAKLKLGIE